MALQIIAKGRVARDLADPTLLILITDGKAEHWALPGWASPYIGKRIVVSVEEPEEEIDPVISKRLKELIWPMKA